MYLDYVKRVKINTVQAIILNDIITICSKLINDQVRLPDDLMCKIDNISFNNELDNKLVEITIKLKYVIMCHKYMIYKEQFMGEELNDLSMRIDSYRPHRKKDISRNNVGKSGTASI